MHMRDFYCLIRLNVAKAHQAPVLHCQQSLYRKLFITTVQSAGRHGTPLIPTAPQGFNEVLVGELKRTFR